MLLLLIYIIAWLISLKMMNAGSMEKKYVYTLPIKFKNVVNISITSKYCPSSIKSCNHNSPGMGVKWNVACRFKYPS